MFLSIRIFFFILIVGVSSISCNTNKEIVNSQLSIPAILSDHMVLQRDHEIPIWGNAVANTKITVEFNGRTKYCITNPSGEWEVKFPKHKVGGPYQIKITSKDKEIILKDILIGEVWLASGQSNMHLDLSRTLNGKEVAKKATNPNIRIYNMKPTYPTGKEGIHTQAELDSIQNNHYFKTTDWFEVNPENIRYFSAVAYYFSEKLQKELDIPIGIIHNAVPGSPIESWLPKKEIVNDSLLSEFVTQRWIDKVEEKDQLIIVAKNQISTSKRQNQKHPWMPYYNYINGIIPIKHYPIKGAIWYQGESNAEHPNLYKKMFSKMSQTWRTDWDYDFPFYYVQLTSREDRPAWSEFRNAQRELLDEVLNSKMVVITDIGDRQDTHAKNKKPVGERLAILALGNTYHKGMNFESPLFDKIVFREGDYYIHFKGEFNRLKTSNAKAIVGFEISNNNQSFNKLTTTIQGNFVKFKLPKSFDKHFFIRYAWKPYTEANLTSGSGLPVSSFRAEF